MTQDDVEARSDVVYTDQLWIVDISDGMCKVRETVPNVVACRSTRLPETGLKVALRHLKQRRSKLKERSQVKQESSAKLTNQRVSYAFTSSPLSFHARHILPTSKFPA